MHHFRRWHLVPLRHNGPSRDRWIDVGSPREAFFANPRIGLGAISPGNKCRFEAVFRGFKLTS